MKNKDKLEKIIKAIKTDRDYCGDYTSAKELAFKIQSYWHNKGYPNVRVWVETIDLTSGSKRYDIRGNIEFNYSSIKSLLK